MSYIIEHDDCIAWMRRLPDACIDAIVTDPPYGLGFMGRAWDALPPGPDFAAEALRVLKPGGHIVAFGGTRTCHRLTVALEDAGFEIRDVGGWVYYSGFPKSLDVSKAIDAAAGAEREVVGVRPGTGNRSFGGEADGKGFGPVVDVTAPATPEAARWSGWGTALKPAIEPWVLARKPLIGTVAANVLAHRTGAINIDGCRLAPGDRAWVGPAGDNAGWGGGAGYTGGAMVGGWGLGKSGEARPAEGRWPANLYYCPKAARSERERGCDGLPARASAAVEHHGEGTAALSSPRAGAGRTATAVRNHHPTVKPVRLMRWLVRLVTPPGGIVLDPFLGSGTTGIAAVLEGASFVGVEREADFVAIATARIEHAVEHPAAWASTAPGAK